MGDGIKGLGERFNEPHLDCKKEKGGKESGRGKRRSRMCAVFSTVSRTGHFNRKPGFRYQCALTKVRQVSFFLATQKQCSSPSACLVKLSEAVRRRAKPSQSLKTATTLYQIPPHTNKKYLLLAFSFFCQSCGNASSSQPTLRRSLIRTGNSLFPCHFLQFCRHRYILALPIPCGQHSNDAYYCPPPKSSL